MTDSHGRLVDFRNTLLLLTSNLGAEAITAHFMRDGERATNAKEESERSSRYLGLQLARSHFSRELVARLDDVLLFQPLSKEDLQRICERQLCKGVELPLLKQGEVIWLNILFPFSLILINRIDQGTFLSRPR